MRAGRLLPVLALAAVAACGGGEGTGSDSTSTTPSPTVSVPPAPPASTGSSTAPTAPTTPTGTSTTTTTPTADGSALPQSWLRYGADGLYLASADGEQRLVDEPIGWAASDGAGGVLFTEWNPDRFGPTWWLPGGAAEPELVSEWDDPLIAARVDGLPAAVGGLPTAECGSDGVTHMVARILTTGEDVTLHCYLSGPDAGDSVDSFGGGLYVGVAWDAVHEVTGRSTALRLVFRDDDGNVVELPANPYHGDCSPCELVAALSPDGARLAVVHRPDAPPFRPDEYAQWLASTASVASELQVFDLRTGELQFSRSLPAGSYPERGSWFDGRYVVLGPDTLAFPWVTPGDRGDAVRTLQELLTALGADIEIDGIFGAGTQATVEAFHLDRFGRARSTVGPDTWAELGVPTTIVDTETGTSTELPGRIALELILADGPPPAAVSPAGLEVPAILRPDGIGPFTFGDDVDEVRSWVAEQLGEPDTAVVEAGAGGWPLASCAERQFAYWAGAGLTVGFTDLVGDDTNASTDCDDTPRLAGWYLVDEGPPWFAPGHGEAPAPAIELWLTTGTGVGLGTTAAELSAAEPTVEFGDWDIDEYAPATFRTSGGLSGRVGWDPVADVQRALVEQGAALAVDGTAGPRTLAALAAFQSSNGIDERGIGPLTLAALGVDVPAGAQVVYLSAGTWDWSF